MLRILAITLLALAIVVTAAAAQTATTTQPAQSTTTSNQGAFDKLSPGNQKIAQALYEAQQTSTQPGGSPKPLSLDEIAAMKQHKGWGEIFKNLKANGYYPDYKNLGQVVSHASHQAHPGTSGAATITSGSKPTPAGHGGSHVSVSGTTLQEVEQKLFAQQGGLATGNTPFDARFRDLSLTQADRQRFLQDVQKLNQLPEGSRVRYEGQMDGQRFHVDAWNRKGELDVRMNGVQFGSREDAQAFIDSLRQGGADRVRIKGTIDNQRFHASFWEHNGRVEQRFQVKEPKNGTLITSASGRSQVAGNSSKPEVAGKPGKGHFDDSASGGTRGSSGVSSGSGKGYGNGSSSGPNASAGRGSNGGGQGVGRGK